MALCDEPYILKLKENINELNAQRRVIDMGGYCPLCGEPEDPREMEDHHIAGRRNSDITIPLCYSCHRRLSDRQRRWPKDWSRPHNPPEVRKALILRSLEEINQLAKIELRRIEWEAEGRQA